MKLTPITYFAILVVIALIAAGATAMITANNGAESQKDQGKTSPLPSSMSASQQTSQTPQANEASASPPVDTSTPTPVTTITVTPGPTATPIPTASVTAQPTSTPTLDETLTPTPIVTGTPGGDWGDVNITVTGLSAESNCNINVTRPSDGYSTGAIIGGSTGNIFGPPHHIFNLRYGTYLVKVEDAKQKVLNSQTITVSTPSMSVSIPATQ